MLKLNFHLTWPFCFAQPAINNSKRGECSTLEALASMAESDITAICLQLAELPVNEDTNATSAAVQVLGTVELVEQILSHLPCLDALSARNVCKVWKNLVAASNLLQRGCFLKPSSEPLPLTDVWVEASQNGHKAHQAAQSWRKQRQEASKSVVMEHNWREITPAMVILNSSKSGYHVINPFVQHALRLLDIDYQKQYRALAKALGKMAPNSLWLGTFLSQPPTTCVQLASVEYSSEVRFLNKEGRMHDTINNPTGVTLKDLVLYMQKDQGKIRWSSGWYPLYAGILETGNKEADAAAKENRRISLRP
jgi:hypothetical protein